MKSLKSQGFRQAILAAGLMMAWQVAAKATRDGLFLTSFSPSALPAIIGASAVSSILLAFLSTKLLRRFGPFRLIPLGYVLGSALHVGEWMLLPRFPGPIAAVIYVHVVALGSVLLSGFWALANERFDPREARRQFGRITAFGTLGCLAGGLIAERVATLDSTADLLILLAALQLACSVALFRFAPAKSGQKISPAPPFPDVISGAPYLIALALFVVLTAMSASTLDYLFKFQAVAEFGRGPVLSRFFALFYAVTSAATFVLQAGVSRLWLKHFGPGKTVAVLPVAVTGASLLSLAIPGALAVIGSRALELLLRGSMFLSGYELFYTPMPPAEKRSTKSVIDIGAARLGDGLAAASIQLLLALPVQMASSAILAFTAMLSGIAAWLAFRLDRAYVVVLEKGLATNTVSISPEETEDDLTQSIVLRSASSITSPLRSFAAETSAIKPAPIADPLVRRLAELRSNDPSRIKDALRTPLELVLVPQVIDLLGRDEVAQAAYSALTRISNRIAGQLADALADQSREFQIRKRIPKILASCDCGEARDGLLRQLRDEQFEIRTRCGRALERMILRHPQHQPERAVIFEIVHSEIVAARQMGEVGRESASKNIAHIFTLLGLVLPPQPVRLALRALRTEDGKLRGMALEYLDSVLPRALREELAAYLEAPVAIKTAVAAEATGPRSVAPEKMGELQAGDINIEAAQSSEGGSK